MNLKSASKVPTYLAIFSLIFFSQATLAFEPEIDVQLRHEDNVRRTSEKIRQGDSIIALKPVLPLLWDFGKRKLDLTYEGEYARYFDQGELDYNDHHLGGHLLVDHSSRLNTEFELGHIREHDIPDDNDVVARPTGEPNKWKESYAEASLLYGNPSSRGQLITKLEYQQRNYTNNNQEFLDVDRTGLSGTFYYRINPRLRIPFELNITNYDYQNTTPATDPGSNEYKYLAGVAWEATGKSTGIFQLGLLEKKYDNSLFDDTSILLLRLDGTWRPNTFTNMVFGAIRDTEESLQPFSRAYIQNHLHTEITHMVTPRTMLFFGVRYTTAVSDDQAAIKENRYNVQLEARYDLLRWLDLSAGYNYVERDSELDYLDFKTNIFTLTAEAQLEL